MTDTYREKLHSMSADELDAQLQSTHEQVDRMLSDPNSSIDDLRAESEQMVEIYTELGRSSRW